MRDRLIIDGKQVDKFLLAGTRWAMTHYDSSKQGSNLFSEVKHDKLVYSVYAALRPYYAALKTSNRMSGLFIGAGARIYIDLLAAQSKISSITPNLEAREDMWRQRFGHLQSPAERAHKFVQLVIDGIDSTSAFDPATDGVALRLRESHLKARSIRQAWSTPDAYRLILSAASHFMYGRSPSKLYVSSSDPFVYSYEDLLSSYE
jgi:hypothetical protein